MKKFFAVFIAAIMIAGFSGCNENKAGGKIEGSLEEIMAKVYEGSKLEMPALVNTVIDRDNAGYFIGTEDISYTEGLASEPMINAIAHSIVLIRTDDSDVEAAKNKIKENINGFKWICVGVDNENIIVDNIGNLIILIMDKDSKVLRESFLNLAE